MTNHILVFNAGSSSLKFALFDTRLENAVRGQIDWSSETREAKLSIGQSLQQALGAVDTRAAVRAVLDALLAQKFVKDLTSIVAVGQRVVHGGTKFTEPTLINDSVIQEIEKLSEIAPLHNPPALQAIAGVTAALPKTPQFAVFDTAYFQTLPPERFIYPLPYEWYSQWGIRRFGFHGISHAYCAQRAAAFLKRSDLRLISCHLGQGASVTASRARQAIATTMGFTPLEGVMMGSRSGSIDPSILLYVQRHHGLGPEQLKDILNYASGIKGISGISNDSREVAERALQGNKRAQLAMAMFVDRVRAAIGAMAVTLGGVDAIVFTAGIGEHAVDIRRQISEGLECLGLIVDLGANHSARADCDIAQSHSRVRALVLHTEEEQAIARAVAGLLEK